MTEFASRIESWYATNGRDLPWRNTRDPYEIWISEIILQQTQVAQGYDYYQRFIERFPTVEALAFASRDEVMQQWEGLGYYSRARNLHAAAQRIVEMGAFPDTYEGVRSLKGVGDYTAAAISSFAYGLPHAVVDGNVYRVLSRYFGISTPIDSSAGKREFSTLAQELLDKKNPALYNQAIMDFGALQCVPRNPSCADCPFSDSCVALKENTVAGLPVKSKKTTVKERFFHYIIILEESGLYIHRRSGGDIWKGLYEPLLIENDRQHCATDVVPAGYQLLKEVSNIKHQLTHRTILADAYLVQKENDTPGIILPEDFFRVELSEIEQYAVPRLVKIIYQKLLDI